MMVYTSVDIVLQLHKCRIKSFLVKAIMPYVIIGGMGACQKKAETKKGDIPIVENSIPLCVGGDASSNILKGLAKPVFRTGIGNSHLVITTKSKEAQRWFDQGLNHLHGFWHLEAYRAFQQVIENDPDCAMGYWGIALCQPGFGGDDKSVWQKAIDKATALSGMVSPIEKDFINATSALVKQGLAETTLQVFRKLYQTYPDEPEAIAWASIMLRQHEKEASQQEAIQLLEKSLRRFPENVALMHYYIHVMELRQEFAKAIPVAEQMIKIAPNAPHITHMPGHLYYLKGNYEKAINAYAKAKKQETGYHISEKVPFSANQNYVHNLHFLAVAQAEAGDEKAALETATSLANVVLETQPINEGAAMMLHYEGKVLPAWVHIRFGEWQKAVAYLETILNHSQRPIQNPLVTIYYQTLRLYCLGMQAVQQQRLQDANQYGMELSQLMQQYEQQGATKQATAEFKSINETYDIMNMMRYELAGWVDNMDKTQPFNEAAWTEALSLQSAIKYDEPPRLMAPVEEQLALLRKFRGEQTAYRQAKQQALQKRPNSPLIHLI